MKQGKRDPRIEDTCSLLAVHFRRLVIDEAHVLYSKTALMKFVIDVRAISRWACTGTPIPGNKLQALHGLLQFLKHEIFSDR